MNKSGLVLIFSLLLVFTLVLSMLGSKSKEKELLEMQRHYLLEKQAKEEYQFLRKTSLNNRFVFLDHLCLTNRQMESCTPHAIIRKPTLVLYFNEMMCNACIGQYINLFNQLQKQYETPALLILVNFYEKDKIRYFHEVYNTEIPAYLVDKQDLPFHYDPNYPFIFVWHPDILATSFYQDPLQHENQDSIINATYKRMVDKLQIL